MRLPCVLLLLGGGCFQPGEPAPPPRPLLPVPLAPAPAVPCFDTYVGGGLPIAAKASTRDPVADACGAPGRGFVFTWTAPGAGPYTVAVAAAFPVTIDVADGTDGSCIGPSIACGVGGAAVTFTARPGHLVNIAVVARDGAGGPLELDIDGLAGTCGDGVCGGDEDCASCPGDCGACPPVCGDGVCAAGEDCASCAADCGACPACGDGVCNGAETCASCPGDCDACPVCGDGFCDRRESWGDCPEDCSYIPSCGDGRCDAGELCDVCVSDCGTCP